jgi:opacity protein-like surface antigen
MTKAVKVFVMLKLLSVVSLLWGQGGFELTPTVGYRFGGNIDLQNPVLNPNFRKLEIKSNPSYGVGLNYAVHDNVQIEFRWSRQDTHINGVARADNTTTRLFGAYLDQYHFNFLLHPADLGEHTQPYFVAGVGATSFDPRAHLSSKTQFSFEVGGGLKYFFVPRVGLRVEAKWAPTYVKSNQDWFCNGFNTCFTVSDPVYAQQAEISSGIIIRF